MEKPTHTWPLDRNRYLTNKVTVVRKLHRLGYLDVFLMTPMF